MELEYRMVAGPGYCFSQKSADSLVGQKFHRQEDPSGTVVAARLDGCDLILTIEAD